MPFSTRSKFFSLILDFYLQVLFVAGSKIFRRGEITTGVFGEKIKNRQTRRKKKPGDCVSGGLTDGALSAAGV
jgi:hypothetical protein